MVPPFQAAAQQQQQQQEPVRVAHEQVGKFDTFQVSYCNLKGYLANVCFVSFTKYVE